MSEAQRADILVVDDLPEKHLTYRVDLEELEQNIVTVTSGEEALQVAAGARIRRHPARCQHAGHVGAGNGGDDPAAQEIAAHAHHLRHGVRRRRADGRRLCRWARSTTS